MKYDIVIVGAGPAGATAAKYLAEQHVNVLLIEKETLPRDKPCGGGIPMKVVNMFPYLSQNDVISTYSYCCSVYFHTFEKPLTVHLDEPCLGMVLRKDFDYKLVQMAMNSGAKLLDGKTVTDVTVDDAKVTITLQDGSTVDADIVIGADGTWSTIAKKTGLKKKKQLVGVCVYEERRIDKENSSTFFDNHNCFHIIFGFEGIKGYGWVFPKESYVNIGIGEFTDRYKTANKKKNLNNLYSRYITALKESNILPEEYMIGKLQGGALPLRPLDKAYSDRVLLVGDAAGLANPVSGAGIYYAMTSGMIAATVAAQALQVGDTSARFLSKYEDLFWKHDSGKELKLMIRASKYLGKRMERIFTIAVSDKQLTDMGVKILIGDMESKNMRGKLIRRLIYVYLKSIFSKRKK